SERDALLLRDDGAGQRRVDVSDHQHQGGAVGPAILLEPEHDPAGLLGVRPAAGLEAHVGRRDAELFEEHVVHLAVVVLAGVHDVETQAVAGAAQRAHDRRDLHEIGPGTGHDRDSLHDAALSSSISCRVWRMFERLEAPNTIERICGRWHPYSSACCGGMAPEAITDMATGRKRRVAMAVS